MVSIAVSRKYIDALTINTDLWLMRISFQPRLTMWNKIENIVVQESKRAFNDFKFFLFSI